jgi:hypothetical protein
VVENSRLVKGEHVSKGAPVLVEAVSLEEDFFPGGEVRGGVLGSPKTSPPC